VSDGPRGESRLDYAGAGVDIERSDAVKRRIRSIVESTFTAGARGAFGGFGGMYRIPADARRPVLVASADGVGTKLRVAFMAGVHHTIGIDLVNHCVNDILVQGAQPLFFLDYLATGRLDPAVAVQVVEGLAAGCRGNGCALLGGETAEMPGFYADGEYDVAGFIVGAVARDKVIDGRSIAPGDVLIGLPSSGLHTNGYSLARRIVFDVAGLAIDSPAPGLGMSIGDALLAPHRSYLQTLRPLLGTALIKGMAHITGGGLTDNLPRVFPEGTSPRVNLRAWTPPPLFAFLREAGDVPEDDMLRTFNMGIGLVVVCARQDEARIHRALADGGEPGAVTIGSAIAGDGRVAYER
jgi:phosphoribosylformylglycinamidine cyclo-ligase